MGAASRAKRLAFTNGVLLVMDGPFAESKELVGGFAILDLPGIEEAVDLCRTYAKICPSEENLCMGHFAHTS